MLIEYIILATLGFFAGMICTHLSLESSYNSIPFLKKKPNNSKEGKSLTIGQTAYGVIGQNFYEGKITKIVLTEYYSEVVIDNSMNFDLKHIFSDKEEILKHMK